MEKRLRVVGEDEDEGDPPAEHLWVAEDDDVQDEHADHAHGDDDEAYVADSSPSHGSHSCRLLNLRRARRRRRARVRRQAVHWPSTEQICR